MKNNDQNVSLSNHIKEFLNLLTVCQQQYNIAVDEEKTQDNLTQDILHSLELDGLKYDDRAKLATKLMQNRQARRIQKDQREELQPLIDFLNDQNNRTIISKLQKCLGEIRKVEKKHIYRCYIPRVMIKSEEE